MGNKIIFIFLLAVSALVLLTAAITGWSREELLPGPPKQEKADEPGTKQFVEKSPEPAMVYEKIISNNLFSPTRKEITIKAVKNNSANQAESMPETKPEVKEVRVDGTKINLLGIMFLENIHKALITNPNHGETAKENIWVKVGDRPANLEVTAVAEDHIVLKERGKKYIVLLRDKSKSAKEKTIRQQAVPTVVSAGSVPRPAVKTNQGKAAGETDEYIMVKTPFGFIKRKK